MSELHLVNKLLDFDSNLSNEEKLIRDSVREYVDKHVITSINEYFEKGIYPQNMGKTLGGLGLFGMTLPEQYGGSNSSSLAYGLVCHELERGDSALRSYVSVQSSLCMYPIYAYGSDAQKNKYLRAMSTGDLIGCFGLTEPDSGSDPSSMKTVAVKSGNGYILNGSKMWITNATIADLAIVWAKLNNSVAGFVVDLKNTEGVTATEIKHKMSLRASITGELAFNNVQLPEDSLLPITLEKGLGAALGCLTQARYGIAWGAMGAAEFCFEAALEYAKTRKQFNKPIAANQLIQKQLVDIYTELCKARMFNLNLAHMKDNNKLDFIAVSMGKMNSCKKSLEIARQCRNILGANGISLEYHVIRHMNNLESVFTYEGTDNIHTLAIGRYLTGMNAFC